MYTVLLAYLLPSSFMKLQISTGALTEKGPVPFFYYNDINHVLLDIPELLNEGVGIFYE
jgi:hypothetical protein